MGPFGREVSIEEVIPGDIVQISFDGVKFSHSPFIIEVFNGLGLLGINVATHTDDSDYRPLSTYNFRKIRFVHIGGVRVS